MVVKNIQIHGVIINGKWIYKSKIESKNFCYPQAKLSHHLLSSRPRLIQITLECLIVVQSPHPLLINFSIFSHQGHSYFNPLVYWLLGKVSNPDKFFGTIYLCGLFGNFSKQTALLYCVFFCKFV